MQVSAVYDLLVATPHEPADARFTAEQFAVYNEGYQMALTQAMNVLRAAGDRYRMRVRTLKLQTKRRNARK